MYDIEAPARPVEPWQLAVEARRATCLMRRVIAAQQLLEIYGYKVIRPARVHPDLVASKISDAA